MSNASNIPWVEKYRPTQTEDIVLSPLNKQIINAIITQRHFPNMLFHGPPGTGKTTTIVNIIREYHKREGLPSSKGLIIHLNASDERGIDVIRNQIYQFVQSRSLTHIKDGTATTGTKFVILDEVDCMTKNAQQAFRCLLQIVTNEFRTTRFCLVCNYISKIDEGLQHEFMKLRFNQLPNFEIEQFLTKISVSESLGLSPKTICAIRKNYDSDIRSMINFMQANQQLLDVKEAEIAWMGVMDSETMERVLQSEDIYEKIGSESIRCNTNRRTFITALLNYIVRNKQYDGAFLETTEVRALASTQGVIKTSISEFLDIVKTAMHADECNEDYLVRFVAAKLDQVT